MLLQLWALVRAASPFWLILSILLAAEQSRAQEAISEDTGELYEWLDKAMDPRIKTAALIGIRDEHVPASSRFIGSNWFGAYEFCYLLAEDDGRITVLTADLAIESFARRDVKYGRGSFKKSGEVLLDQMDRDNPMLSGSWRRLSPRGVLCVFAFALERAGHPVLARQLLVQVKDLLNAGEPLLPNVREDIGKALVWHALVDLERPESSRSTVLERLERVKRLCVASTFDDRLDGYIETLRLMVVEVPPAAEEPPVQHLLYALRDQSAVPAAFAFREKGADFLPGGLSNPFAELKTLDRAAVPELIAALDDSRLTRTGCYVRDVRERYAFENFHVLTVSTYVLAALEAMAGQRFHDSVVLSPEDVPLVKRRVEAWWQKVE